MNPSVELRAALASSDDVLRWAASRGWRPSPEPPPASPRRSLEACVHLAPESAHDAPNVLMLWDASLTERGCDGARLRLLQRQMNDYADALRHRADAPALAWVASPEMLLAFPLQGDPFARRLRFTPGRLLKESTPLTRHFGRFRAETVASWIIRPAVDAIFAVGGPTWNFSELFVGEVLDEDFVDFMTALRRDLSGRVLGQPGLLDRMLGCLSEPGGPPPTVAALIHDRTLRTGVIAAVDTVLLRVVLYRYLEAQFGHRPTPEEQRIAFGTYEDLVKATVDVQHVNLPANKKGLLLPFMSSVADPSRFTGEVRRRGDAWRLDAGGDLHHGAIADAADRLYEWLLQNAPNPLADLLTATSSEAYSFHFADLDPRAFQDFYQKTIGTDIHVRYDATTGRVGTPEVVDRRRNRKEQGAYYTADPLANWLVNRTIGPWFAEWKRELEAAGDDEAKLASALDRLLDLRVLDPTCGGGIFLRAAFEHLSRAREGIVQVVGPHPITTKGRYRLFREEAGPGEWEWHLLLHTLYGVDVDVKALNVASNLLTLSALTYKRDGVCFPSFVNVSLKRGNALVVPLREEEREAFGAENQRELAELLDLRATLRDPQLARETWKAKHEQARRLTRALTDARIRVAFRDVFPAGEVVERARRVGCFLYEAEFPEVFFAVVPAKRGKPRVVVRANPGFDVVLGNPPWEEPAKEKKKFLPEFDPDYADLTGGDAERREAELLADPEIAARWEVFCASVDDYKALLSGKGQEGGGWFRHQKRAVRGRTPGAHTNLYKYATELAWRVLREGGRAGLVVDGGLWTDLASSGLRALLLDRSVTEAVCGFTNRDDIFPDIDNRTKIAANAFRRGGRTEALRAVFMQAELAILDRFDEVAVTLDAEAIRTHRRDSYPVPEVRSPAHLVLLSRVDEVSSLGEPPWGVETYSRELNAGEQRGYFHADPPAGFYPLVEGTQFNLFGVFQGALPESGVDPSDAGAGGFLREKQRGRVLDAIAAHVEEQNGPIRGGKRAAARAWVKARTGSEDLPDEWVRLDWEGFRLAWRDIARSDDKRTLLAGILPPRVAVSHTAPYVRPFRLIVGEEAVSYSLQLPLEQLLYLGGMLASFACDAVVRTRHAKTHLTSDTFAALPVPPWLGTPEDRRIAELTARLTCRSATAERPWADYGDLAAAVGLDCARDGLTEALARTDAEVELNVLAARRYGLDRNDVVGLMDLLFMTPDAKPAHTSMRDRIAARMG